MTDNRSEITLRSSIVYVSMLIVAILIVWKMFYIQISEGEKYRKTDSERNVRIRTIEASRGNIYSEDGSLLATSAPVFDLFWDSSVCPDSTFKKGIDSLSICLANHFKNKTSSEYKAIFTNAKSKKIRYLTIKRSNLRSDKDQVSYTDLKKIKNFPIFRLGKNKGGLIFEQKNIRKMPYKILAYRTIGYEQIVRNKNGRDTGLFVGLEGAYTQYLKGIDGRRVEQKIRGGIWMPLTDEDQIEPQNGNDIYTSINISLQDVAEHALMKQLDSTSADHGCVVLMEVQTGFIRAIANLKRRSDGSYGEDINFAIWESSEPGSTFKLASLVALLEDGRVDTNELVPTGKRKFGKFEMKDSHEDGYGNISLKRAFEVSSNVAFASIVSRVFADRPQAYVDLLKRFGLGNKLGIEISGEGEPLIKDYKNKSWSATTLPWMSIGYEMHITPLQLLAFYNAIANNGKLVKPQFVKEIRHAGQIIKTNEPIVLNNQICSQKTVDKVKSCMEGVVEHGTAKKLSNQVFKIAGKTGTAQIAKKGGYGNKKDEARNVEYKASFVGYFPADNPKFSCIVVINNPRRKGFYGAEVAAPVFREIANKVYATEIDIPQYQPDSIRVKNIPLTYTSNQADISTIYSFMRYKTLSDNRQSEWVTANTTSGNFVRLKSQQFENGVVPNVKGMGVKDAVYLIERQGFIASIEGKGVVISQSIKAGTKLKRGEFVHLVLNTPTIPKYTNYNQNDSLMNVALQDSIKLLLKNNKKPKIEPKKDKKQDAKPTKPIKPIKNPKKHN